MAFQLWYSHSLNVPCVPGTGVDLDHLGEGGTVPHYPLIVGLEVPVLSPWNESESLARLVRRKS